VCPGAFASLRFLGDERFVVLMGIHGVLVCLFTEFMRGQMVSFAVGSGCSGVGVGGEVVEFCRSIVGTLWHGLLPGVNPNYDSARTAKLFFIAQCQGMTAPRRTYFWGVGRRSAVKGAAAFHRMALSPVPRHG
jgi:hypothetical protein